MTKNPGTYRHVIQFQEDLNSGELDTYGGSTHNWQAISGSSKVRALIRARQLVHEATHEIECNYRTGLDTTHRGRWVDNTASTRYLYVRHIDDPDQMHDRLVMTAVEDVNE